MQIFKIIYSLCLVQPLTKLKCNKNNHVIQNEKKMEVYINFFDSSYVFFLKEPTQLYNA